MCNIIQVTQLHKCMLSQPNLSLHFPFKEKLKSERLLFSKFNTIINLECPPSPSKELEATGSYRSSDGPADPKTSTQSRIPNPSARRNRDFLELEMETKEF